MKEQTELATATTSIVNVTPDQATAWLAEHNTHNRSLREGKVSLYTRDMRSGHWQFNGDPIRFAADGTLLDGQHRLSAVIRAGVTVPMVVIWGLPREAQETMDIGAARTMADALLLRGEGNSKYLAAIARRVVQFDDNGQMSDNGRMNPTMAEMHDFVAREPNVRRSAEVALRSQNARVPIAPSVIGSAYHLCARLDVPTAELFYVTHLIDCVGLREGDPARVLLRRFQQEAAAGRNMHPDDGFRYTVLAWNYFRDGRAVSKLQAPKGGWGQNSPIPK
jgi:hypothetical protein